MTHQSDDRRSRRQERRTTLTAATVGGVIAGATRAILEWLLHRLTSA